MKERNSRVGNTDGNCCDPRGLTSGSASVPERRWFDIERSEVDVALAAVVDFVVDGVKNGVDAPAFPLAEGGVDFEKAMVRNGGP